MKMILCCKLKTTRKAATLISLVHNEQKLGMDRNQYCYKLLFK